jgi:RNA polymerase sigma factor (sigma-70 family)
VAVRDRQERASGALAGGRRRRPGAGRGAADPWDDVIARLDAAERAGMLARALSALPPDEREVLLLVAWEELTPAQAAAALGVPQGTAPSRLYRARTALRAALAAEEER